MVKKRRKDKENEWTAERSYKVKRYHYVYLVTYHHELPSWKTTQSYTGPGNDVLLLKLVRRSTRAWSSSFSKRVFYKHKNL